MPREIDTKEIDIKYKVYQYCNSKTLFNVSKIQINTASMREK